MFDQMDVEDEQYQIKPMNCPFHVLVRARARSREHARPRGRILAAGRSRARSGAFVARPARLDPRIRFE
jgi:hypothetical protein